MPLDLLGTTAAQLGAAARAHFGSRKGAGLAGAIHHEAVCSGVFAPEALGAAVATAAHWRDLAALALPDVIADRREPGPHGDVRKLLLQFADGNRVECVRLPMGRGRSSLCLSTQAGCARACIFCETGRTGLRRNLTAGEIVAPVTLQGRDRPTSLVFMGMGEPLDNLPGLLGALAVLTDRAGLGYAQERLTVCTVGHVPGIDALRALGWKRLGLAVSLNAADDDRRSRLMPHSCRFPLVEIQAALRRFRQRANLALHVHWCLLPGINDGPDDAAGVAAFCRPLGRVLVHVIPYNPGTAPISRAPRGDEVAAFVGRLRAHGLAVRARVPKGRSVMAACGQLGAVDAAAATSS